MTVLRLAVHLVVLSRHCRKHDASQVNDIDKDKLGKERDRNVDGKKDLYTTRYGVNGGNCSPTTRAFKARTLLAVTMKPWKNDDYNHHGCAHRLGRVVSNWCLSNLL